MTPDKKNIFVKMMSMDDAAWERHANPWSVWTRAFTGLPVLLFAVWSIRMTGWWSILILSLSWLWIWLNPRLFPIPETTDNWASKVSFGERVWLNRSDCPIPEHHSRWALALSIVAGIGFFIAVTGAFFNNIFPTVTGGIISWFGKMWFCDRMVWLYDDMKETIPDYKEWLKNS